MIEYLIYNGNNIKESPETEERVKNFFNDNLTDDENLKWKLHASRMLKDGTYTKTTWVQRGRFRFDIEYHSNKQFFYIFCRYDNNNREYNNGTNRTVTLNQIKAFGSDNAALYKTIKKWQEDFIKEITLI